MKTLATISSCIVLMSASLHAGQKPVPAPGDPIHMVSPKYPKDARKKNVEGTVTVHVSIGADGSVKDAAVVNGDSRLTMLRSRRSGSGDFSRSPRTASRWRANAT
jgi:hypothetical protein